MRVAFGACVSAAAVGVAFWVRSRYGQLQMSLGAAGAGIAGGYATLAAAAARYDLVPDWLALPLAGGLAALAVVIAIAWSSETVAAIGLLGAALAPALQAIDTGLSWPAVGVRGDHLRRDRGARRAASLAQAADRDRRRRRSAGCAARARRRRDRPAQAPPPSSPRSCWSCSLRESGCSSSPGRRISIRSRARSCSPPSASRSCSCGRCGTSTAIRASRSPARPWSGPSPGSRSAASSLPSPSCSACRRSRLPPSPPPICCRERASHSPGRPRRCSSRSSPCGCAMRACRQPRSSTAPSPRRTCSSSTHRRS